MPWLRTPYWCKALDYLDSEVLVHKQVGALQVAVYNRGLAAVQVIHSCRENAALREVPCLGGSHLQEG